MPRFTYLDNEIEFMEEARYVIAENIDYLIKNKPEILLTKFVLPKKKWTPHNCFHPTKHHRLINIASFRYLRDILLNPETQTGKWEIKRANKKFSQIYDCFVHVEQTQNGSIYVKIAVIYDRWHVEPLTPSLIGYSFHN